MKAYNYFEKPSRENSNTNLKIQIDSHSYRNIHSEIYDYQLGPFIIEKIQKCFMKFFEKSYLPEILKKFFVYSDYFYRISKQKTLDFSFYQRLT